MQSSKLCRTTVTIDIASLREYVGENMKFPPLPKNDMVAMPYVYLFQLAHTDVPGSGEKGKGDFGSVGKTIVVIITGKLVMDADSHCFAASP